MRIFERRALVAILMAGALATVWNCGSSTTCLRYSDCDQGLTCASGLCVIAGDGASDGGDGGDETVTTADAQVTVVDSGTVIVAADASPTSDASSADAAIADASTD